MDQEQQIVQQIVNCNTKNEQINSFVEGIQQSLIILSQNTCSPIEITSKQAVHQQIVKQTKASKSISVQLKNKRYTEENQKLTIAEHQKQKRHQKSRFQLQEYNAYNRAAELVTKMNQQRKQMNNKKLKANQRIHMQIQQSLKFIEKINEETQKVHEKKRQKIEKRIQNRKNEMETQLQYDKMANNYLNQLRKSRGSLPILRVNERSRSILGEYQKKSLKKYRRSIFLDSIEKEEQKRKIDQIKKNEQKYKIKQRQRIFSQKFCAKNKRKQHNT